MKPLTSVENRIFKLIIMLLINNRFALFANRGSRVERGRVIFVVFTRFP